MNERFNIEVPLDTRREHIHLEAQGGSMVQRPNIQRVLTSCRRVAVVCCVLAGCGPRTASDQVAAAPERITAEDLQEIATIPAEYVERTLAGDWDGVAELYHPEAIQMPPDAPPVVGREAIREHLARTLGAEGGVRLEDFTVNVLEAEAMGELVYVGALYRYEVSTIVNGEEVTYEQRGPYINLLRQDDAGTWRIYRQIYNRAHPPTEGML